MDGNGDFNSSYNYTIDHFPNSQQSQPYGPPVFPANYGQNNTFSSASDFGFIQDHSSNSGQKFPVGNESGFPSNYSDGNNYPRDNSLYQNPELYTYPEIASNTASNMYPETRISRPEIVGYNCNDEKSGILNAVIKVEKDIEDTPVLKETSNNLTKDVDHVFDKDKVNQENLKAECYVDIAENEEEMSNGEPETKEKVKNDTESADMKEQSDEDSEDYDMKEETDDVSEYDSDSTIIEESHENENFEEKVIENKTKGKRQTTNKKKAETKVKKSPRKKEFKCEVCKKVLTSNRALEKHGNLHTGKYSCEICGKYCNSQTSLESHAKVHQGYIGSDVCNVCDKTFYDKSSLNKHTLSVHMGIKNFQCEYCELSFYARKTYDEHVRVHTGERPFKCELCPKSYKRIADLNHHMRLHKGEVSHTCEICGEGFRRSSELKRHMQKHNESEEKGPPKPLQKFACEFCGITFSTVNRRNKHAAMHLESLERQMVDVRRTDSFTADTQRFVDTIVHGLGTDHFGQSHLYQNRLNSSEDEIGSKDTNSEDVSPQNELTVGKIVFGAQLSTAVKTQNLNPESERNVNKQTAKQDHGKSEGHHVFYRQIDKDRGNSTLKGLHDSNENKKVINETCKGAVDNDTALEEDMDFSDEADADEEKVDYSIDKEPTNNIKIERTEIKVEIDCDEVNNDYFERANDSFNYNDGLTEANDDYGSETEVEDYSDLIKEHDDSDSSDYVVKSKSKRKKYTPKTKLKVKSKLKPAKKVKNKVEKQKTENDNSMDSADLNEEIREQDHSKDGTRETKRRKGKPKRRTVNDKSEEPGSFFCEECGKMFSRKDCFHKHMNIHTGVYTCELCNKPFASQASLDTHMANHDGKKLKTATCKVCDKVFYDSSSLNKHVKNVHMNFRPFACTDCDRRFSERKTLVEHIRVHTGERPFACELCGQTFKRHSELNFHIKKHTGETKLTCSECGEGFRRPSELKYHTIVKHRPTADRPFICNLCSKGFMSNFLLQEHFLSHSAERNYECEKCGKGFFSLGKLHRHHRIKSDCRKRPEKVNGVYKCKYCFVEFLELPDLKSHSKEFHEGTTKKYSCQVCFKEFGRQQALKRHLKIHSQTRDFKCKTCGAGFIQKHHLTQHERTHTGEKPFQCKICLKNFAQSATLYSHMKHH